MTTAEKVVVLRVEYDDADDFLADYEQALRHGSTCVAYSGSLGVGTRIRLEIAFPELLNAISVDGTVQSMRADGEPVVEIMFGDGDHLSSAAARVRDRDPDVVRRSLRVLVVEDNPHVADLLRYGMSDPTRGLGRDAAIKIVTATNGHEALERMRAQPFDALVVDVYLPLIDGPTVIAAVRREQRTSSLPIVAVSAGGDAAHAAAMTAGANIFLDKPMRLQKLVETMRSLMKLDGDP